jgi:hypothetical protein
MGCNPISDLTGCLGPAAGGQASVTGAPGWSAICESFAKAAQQLLSSFASSFVSIPPVSLSYSGVRSVYGLSLEIAALVAAVLLMAQVIRTLLTHDGSAISQGLIGVAKAVLAFALTLGASATALRAADELTRWIITRGFGSPAALSARLARLVSFSSGVSASLMLVLALLGILLTLALWAQLLARNVAVTVLVAVSPIAAAGQIAHATQQWWRRLVMAAIQLIALKPAVALILVIGLTVPGVTGSVERLLTGMLVLLLASCAWPVMARASAVLEVYVSGGALSGHRGSSRAAGTDSSPAGIDPADLSRLAEARTMTVVHELRTGAAAGKLKSAMAGRFWPDPVPGGWPARTAAPAEPAPAEPAPAELGPAEPAALGTRAAGGAR